MNLRFKTLAATVANVGSAAANEAEILVAVPVGVTASASTGAGSACTASIST